MTITPPNINFQPIFFLRLIFDFCVTIFHKKIHSRSLNTLIIFQSFEEETVEDVSTVCRTVSLAQLQNSMPLPKVWRGIGRIPHEPQEYVYEYIGES